MFFISILIPVSSLPEMKQMISYFFYPEAAPLHFLNISAAYSVDQNILKSDFIRHMRA